MGCDLPARLLKHTYFCSNVFYCKDTQATYFIIFATLHTRLYCIYLIMDLRTNEV